MVLPPQIHLVSKLIKLICDEKLKKKKGRRIRSCVKNSAKTTTCALSHYATKAGVSKAFLKLVFTEASVICM